MGREIEGWVARLKPKQKMGGYIEVSCSVFSGGSRNRRLKVLCDCGVEAPLVASSTPINKGRVFYGCGLYKVNHFRFLN